ncbi:hypothetical protein RJ640_026326 [Escallonia rubra]|uniref:LOB domain-containing protein n=1 Tax=Escallonia rubra TaxID=112253 RepID=A0AA88UHG2_9ASTE|nr:hypothetical protein RJ640_026326 [Escallonia rubra]
MSIGSLHELQVHQRGDAVSSLVYEANARVRDPVYGCVGAISFLQNQVSQLQMQLAVAQAEILCLHMQQEADQPAVAIMPTPLSPQMGVDDKSFFLHNNLQAQYLNYASNSSNLVIHDTLKRESLFGHDMIKTSSSNSSKMSPVKSFSVLKQKNLDDQAQIVARKKNNIILIEIEWLH